MENRIYINSRLMKVNGDDTKFDINLGNQYTFKRLQLNNFSMDNLLENFYDEWSDFSFKWKYPNLAQEYSVSLTCNQYLAGFSDFLSWFNDVNNNISLLDDSGNLPQYKQNTLLQFYCDNDIEIRLIGQGWEKLGFEYNDNDPYYSNLKTSTRAQDFTQSPAIVVHIENLPSHQISYGAFTFQVANNAEFGGKIQHVFQNALSNQQIVFSSEQSVQYLQFTLRNCDMKKIKTVIDNNNDIEVIMNLSLFKE